MSDWLNGRQNNDMVMNQLRQHYGKSEGADPRSRAYFQREFVEAATQHARGGGGGQSLGGQQPRGRTGGATSINRQQRRGQTVGATSTNRVGRRQQQQQPAQPSARLTNLRAIFNPEGVKKKSRATSTFSKHQSCNERFILWLY